MSKGSKKPWSKVGKLERRVKDLENYYNKLYNNHKIDFEEINKRSQELEERCKIREDHLRSAVSRQHDKIAQTIKRAADALLTQEDG